MAAIKGVKVRDKLRVMQSANLAVEVEVRVMTGAGVEFEADIRVTIMTDAEVRVTVGVRRRDDVDGLLKEVPGSGHEASTSQLDLHSLQPLFLLLHPVHPHLALLHGNDRWDGVGVGALTALSYRQEKDDASLANTDHFTPDIGERVASKVRSILSPSVKNNNTLLSRTPNIESVRV